MNGSLSFDKFCITIIAGFLRVPNVIALKYKEEVCVENGVWIEYLIVLTL